MNFISVKGTQLDEIDFIPTLIVCFYQSDKIETMLQEYRYLQDKFPDVDVVGCSAESVIEDKIPYVDLYNKNSTVYLCMDLNKDAYCIYLSSRDEPILYDKESDQDIIVFSSYSSRILEDRIEALSCIDNISNIVGTVAALSEIDSDDDSKQSVFFNGKLYLDYILSISIKRDQYIVEGYSINIFNPVGLPMKITKAKGTTLLELEDQPALEAIEELAGKLDSDILSKFGYPLFLSKSGSNIDDEDWNSKPLASVISIDRASKSIELYREVVEGEYVKLGIMISKDEQMQRLENICKKMGKSCPTILFFCIGIPLNLGIMEYQYLYHMKKKRDFTFAGFHTFGEIGPAYENNLEFILHNQSMTFAFIREVE